MYTAVIIIIAALIAVATPIEIFWGNDRDIPYNTGCLAIFLGMKFSKKWLAFCYRFCIGVASLLTMIVVAYTFAEMDLSILSYIPAVIATALSVFIPIMAVMLLHLLIVIIFLLISWVIYCF